jgi:hypothetical protein
MNAQIRFPINAIAELHKRPRVSNNSESGMLENHHCPTES